VVEVVGTEVVVTGLGAVVVLVGARVVATVETIDELVEVDGVETGLQAISPTKRTPQRAFIDIRASG
jgi:hypothetical protein